MLCDGPLYKILENANYSTVTERDEKTREQSKLLGLIDLDCGDELIVHS